MIVCHHLRWSAICASSARMFKRSPIGFRIHHSRSYFWKLVSILVTLRSGHPFRLPQAEEMPVTNNPNIQRITENKVHTPTERPAPLHAYASGASDESVMGQQWQGLPAVHCAFKFRLLRNLRPSRFPSIHSRRSDHRFPVNSRRPPCYGRKFGLIGRGYNLKCRGKGYGIQISRIMGMHRSLRF